jgi:hypothetical protein
MQCGEDGESKNPGTNNSGGSAGSTQAKGGTSSTTGGTNAASGGSNNTSGGTTSTGGSNSGSSGNSSTGGATTGPREACSKLALENNVNVTGVSTDRFTWQDSDCKPRTAAMQRAAKGILRQMTYQLSSGSKRTVSGASNSYQGFGVTSNHGLGGGGSSEGLFEALFVGSHHAIYRYQFNVSTDLPVTLDWIFATGRDSPIIAITYDMTKRKPGINADTRTPYGDLAWDGDDNKGKTQVSGVGWGDRYKFTTTKAPLTKNSTWDYAQKNLVPYVIEWTEAPDAEMGLVQTQTWEQKDAGGYGNYANWGKTSANQVRVAGQVGTMPATFNWTYQLNQYELCPTGSDNGCDVTKTTASHRMAWGANYGAIGGDGADGKYDAYGNDKRLSGYPYQSYAVFMVLGEHSKAPVFAQMSDIEVVQGTHLTATTGTVAAMVPGGVARTDLVATAPAGYDPRFSAWSVQAADNKVALKLVVDKGALKSPLLIVTGFTGSTPPSVTLDGAAQRADIDYFMSVDAKSQQLWITLRGALSGSHEISVE